MSSEIIWFPNSYIGVTMSIFLIFGLMSGLISGLSHVPYIRDILHRTTKPERASWFIWTVLGSIAFVTQLSEGATSSLWLTAIDSLGVLVTFILSVKFGEGGLSKRDIYALIGAGIGLILWYFTQHAVVALIITILVDLTGTVLTVIKAYEDPGSETLVTWLGVAVAGLCAMVAVGKIDLILLIYPFYIFLANFAVVVAMLLSNNKSGR